MSETDTVIYDKHGFIEKACESCPIDTSNSTWKVCIQCAHERMTIIRHGLYPQSLASKVKEE